ncbi:hypothetical protein D6C85_02407 [Aureobasidium pullulans]|uniref:Uncharacterized protein n=1 Tax=Aureobasidium pullulans TaxID=5580 RepID=A0A4S9XEE7_AURPU|nr:hypothetical protein D6C85_02407 [Aureobasidium pullulans]
MLSHVFRFAPGMKPYLNDLASESPEVKSINNSFLRYSQDLVLHSFFESQALQITGVGGPLIVEKMNAVLSVGNERAETLNGDHRSICKFGSAEDSNFKRIHQALRKTLSQIIGQGLQSLNENINAHRGLPSTVDSQAADLWRLISEKIPGTCKWLDQNANYDRWITTKDDTLLWIRGPPAAGKSFLAAHVVDKLRGGPNNVCYYFFVKGDKSRTSVSSFLQSMASQTASAVPEVAKLIDDMLKDEPELARAVDHSIIWRKLWLDGILRLKLDTAPKLTWIIDSLDECQADVALSKLLIHLCEKRFARILVTAKADHHTYHVVPRLVNSLDIRIEDTQEDISAYLDQQLDSSETRLRNGILAKSNGCFLWATLVVRRLENVHGLEARLQAIQSEPPGMQDLYANISKSLPDHQLSRTILTWVFCAVRPLSLAELSYVLPGLSDEGDDDAVRTLVFRHCHDLMYVDSNDQVRTRHLSARDFLLRPGIDHGDSGLAIDRATGHKTLALGCLKYLLSSEMNKKSRHKLSISRRRSPFSSYAVDSFYLHLNESPAQDQELLKQLSTFLKSDNLLAWIGYSARKGNLETVLRTAQSLKDFLRRKSKTDLLIGIEVEVVDKWATDLVKLIKRFTGSSSNTSSSSARRISETTSQPGTLTSVASGKSIFAIGSSTGKISLFNNSTCLEEVVIRQDTRVKALRFATCTPVLISVSNRTIHAWNTQTSKPMWSAGIQKECMDLAFVDDERVLLVALQNNVLLTYNALDGTVLDTIEWARRLQGRYGDKFKSKFPLTATFKTELSTLAIVYRGQDIVLWNYEEDTYQLYNHDTGLSDGLTVQMASVNTLLFSRSPESSLLVASYTLADLVLFDVRLKKVKVTVSKAGAYYRLSASPDGRTFAAGANDGTIKLYDFETLRVVYTIRSEDHAITTLAFNHDSVRLFDIRGNGRSCRVWEPAALLRREIETESIRSPSTYSRDNHEDVIDRNDDNDSTVTALACHKEGRYIVGKNDATVWLFDSHSGKAVTQLSKLHASITKLGFHKEHSLLISVDTAGYLFVHRLQLERDEWCAKEVFQHQSMGTGVQHSIMNHKCDRILICANDKAAVYSIPSGQAFDDSIDHEPEVSYAFTNHPTNSNILISAHSQTIRLYSWQNLASVNVKTGINLSQDLESDMQLRGVAPILNNSALIINYSGHGLRVKPRAFSIPIPVISPGSHEIKVIAYQQAVCDQMEYYIGSYQDLEVFLGTDGWICSANKTSFKDKDEVLHHFMPPSDWVRANPRLVINVTDLGDILFAWKGEVAVVKHGLDKDYEVKRVADVL